MYGLIEQIPKYWTKIVYDFEKLGSKLHYMLHKISMVKQD